MPCAVTLGMTCLYYIAVVCGAPLQAVLDFKFEPLCANGPECCNVLGHWRDLNLIYFDLVLLWEVLLSMTNASGKLRGPAWFLNGQRMKAATLQPWVVLKLQLAQVCMTEDCHANASV